MKPVVRELLAALPPKPDEYGALFGAEPSPFLLPHVQVAQRGSVRYVRWGPKLQHSGVIDDRLIYFGKADDAG